jgi:hypothetical protein
MNTKEESWEERFDETFGKAGPDENCDSIGEEAGCDDCATNIELRKKHKEFVREEKARSYKEGDRAGFDRACILYLFVD